MLSRRARTRNSWFLCYIRAYEAPFTRKSLQKYYFFLTWPNYFARKCIFFAFFTNFRVLEALIAHRTCTKWGIVHTKQGSAQKAKKCICSTSPSISEGTRLRACRNFSPLCPRNILPSLPFLPFLFRPFQGDAIARPSSLFPLSSPFRGSGGAFSLPPSGWRALLDRTAGGRP